MRRHNPSIYTSAAAARRAGYGDTGYTKAELLTLLRKRAKENDTDGALVIAAEAVAKGADPHVVDSIFRGSALAIEGTHGNPRRRNHARHISGWDYYEKTDEPWASMKAGFFAPSLEAAKDYAERHFGTRNVRKAEPPSPTGFRDTGTATAPASLIEGLQKLTEYNHHAEALVRLSVATDVAASGKATLAPSALSELTHELEAILAARDRKGYMDEALSKRASAAYKKLIAKAKRVYTAASFAKIHAAL